MTMSTRFSISVISAAFAVCTFAGQAGAAEPQKVSLSSAGTAAGPALLDKSAGAESRPGQYVFSAPPRESRQAATEIYAPIAEYLSKATGKQVAFRYPGDWITYQSDMRKGEYDLVFDGPHLNAWRAANLRHNILVKAAGDHSFVVAVKKDNDRLRDLKQLAGRTICGMSPPNLGTLTVLNEFDNPARQPIIQNTEGWGQIYNAMLTGRCAAAILPTRSLAKYDPQGSAAHVIFKARAYPNQALSASLRVSPEDQAKIARALTLPDARAATARLRDAYAINGDFQLATRDEYAGVASILRDSWGYQ